MTSKPDWRSDPKYGKTDGGVRAWPTFAGLNLLFSWSDDP